MKSNLKFLNLGAIAVAAAAVFLSVVPASPANAAVDIYITPGTHQSGGRDWKTSCEKYSSTVDRCTTQIKATQIRVVKGSYQTISGWVFNNLTYKPVARSQWGKNPLANTGSWTATDGRKWRTECDTAVTGQNGCRSYTVGTVITKVGSRYVKKNEWVFNNMVRFSFNSTPTTPTTPTTPPTTPTTPSDCGVTPPAPAGKVYYAAPGIERCIFAAINRDRVAAGKKALVRDSRIDPIAADWSMHLSQTHKVNIATGSSNLTAQNAHNPDFQPLMYAAFGYVSGFQEAVAVQWGNGNMGPLLHTGLMNSPAHRAIIMDSESTMIGLSVACRSTDGVCFVTEDFSGKAW